MALRITLQKTIKLIIRRELILSLNNDTYRIKKITNRSFESIIDNKKSPFDITYGIRVPYIINNKYTKKK